MCELFGGFYISNIEHIKSTNFIKEAKIDRILNGYKSFEINDDIDSNYNNLENVYSFIKKSIDILLKAHYIDNQRCVVICKEGNRISLLICIYYLSKIANIEKKRAFEIILSKYNIKYNNELISRFIANL
jgi:hypothetical protein